MYMALLIEPWQMTFLCNPQFKHTSCSVTKAKLLLTNCELVNVFVQAKLIYIAYCLYKVGKRGPFKLSSSTQINHKPDRLRPAAC